MKKELCFTKIVAPERMAREDFAAAELVRFAEQPNIQRFMGLFGKMAKKVAEIASRGDMNSSRRKISHERSYRNLF